MAKIIIDPRLKYNYASWYLLGLERHFGKQCIYYDVRPFISLLYKDTKDYNSGFAFVYKDASQEVKYFVDTEDVAKVFLDRYDWCDVYGMVNPTTEQVVQYDKLLPIGPEFGLTLHSKTKTILQCMTLYSKGRKYTDIAFQSYLKDYLYTNIRRRRLERYELPTEMRVNYIFHASTLWYNEFAATDTNKYRGDFLKACQKAGMEIEGGLFYVDGDDVLREMPDYPKYKEMYKDFIYDRRLSMDDYIRKTKESVLVFNTPSVCECHGWKLAEFLCMGKAIISTPLKREMPGEGLVHGENVHFVQSEVEIYDAVMKIKSDSDYRQHLEQGARAYYEQWLAPEVVVKRIIDRACREQ
uniref:Glycosyltransferase n=1 Tax=Prevotella sp. GTC17262 TaxID=3236797 RepID=A0AB33JG41_9BACT